PAVLPEPPRRGDDGVDCGSCAAGTTGAVWYDDRWKVVAPAEPLAIPAVLRCPIAHHDLDTLDVGLAREMGFASWRVERALRALGGVGRVHVNRWGDGGAHLHLWFFARPEGVLQLRGSSLSDWTDCLPPMPDAEWRATMAAVAADLAELGGTPQAR
ncbi:MAG TPA: hypothetical protein VFL59_16285, partial [Candidatus Nanopelagicales bacterium]|nr:hypothetical protein [Candidatus Nanopelagicales bacterium]